jgi:phospholipid/cholesterol/gamma-HCH transport system substrate-binding protein
MKRMEVEVKVGFFVTIGIILVMVGILLLGSTNSIMSKKSLYTLHLKNVEGLMTGSKVLLGGIQIGTVKRIVFDDETRDVRVDLDILNSTSGHIKKDADAEIATLGMLGDKYVSINTGSSEAEPLPPGSDIPIRPSAGLNQFLSSSDQLIARLNNITVSLDHILKDFETGDRSERFFEGISKTAKNMANVTEKLDKQMDDMKFKKIIKNLESITDKVNNGNGTVGALINDPGLYDNIKSLIGQANRNRIVRNLVRQTIKDSEEKPDAPAPAAK